ncbi:MAG: SUF system NifU family Fe-S cluster assembly protein [Verrucomicrobia bacterium]|nr:SUF system NifU family Fe-S cluster assembly protein [Verrucomicrobiota bacterium]
MFDNLNDLYQQVILDHSKAPRNFGELPGADHFAEGRNPLCGDQVSVAVKMQGDVIEDIRFKGSGCAIAKASASVMTTALKGKTLNEARTLFEKFHELVLTGQAAPCAQLGKLSVFGGVHRYPARVKCAILAWHAALAAMAGDQKKVSTE